MRSDKERQLYKHRDKHGTLIGASCPECSGHLEADPELDYSSRRIRCGSCLLRFEDWFEFAAGIVISRKRTDDLEHVDG